MYLTVHYINISGTHIMSLAKFYVYQLKCSKCSKYYIGVTNDPKRRFRQHMLVAKKKWRELTKCGRAVKRYGANTFSMRILDTCNTDSEAKHSEMHWIKIFGKKRLWNSNSGGAGGGKKR